MIDQGVRRPLDLERLSMLVKTSCEGLGDAEPARILKATLKDLYDGVPMDEVRKGVVLAARTLIEKDPAYSCVTARLLLDALRFEALGEEATHADMATKYAEYFPQFIKHGIKIGLLNGRDLPGASSCNSVRVGDLQLHVCHSYTIMLGKGIPRIRRNHCHRPCSSADTAPTASVYQLIYIYAQFGTIPSLGKLIIPSKIILQLILY